jgi:fatty-acyl-CoA synthase
MAYESDPLTFHGRIQDAARIFAEQPWLSFGHDVLSFGDIATHVDDIARGLLTIEVAPGERVGLFMGNRLEWLPLEYGVTALGAVLVPMNTMYHARELSHLIAQSGMQTLIWGSPILGKDTTDLLVELVPELVHADSGSWTSQRFPNLRNVIGVGDAAWPRGVSPLGGVMAAGREVEPSAVAAVASRVAPDDVALLLFTSGTTGAPKGSMLTHRGIISHVASWTSHLGLRSSDRTIMPSPLFWAFGCIVNAVVPLYAGSMVVLEESFDAGRFLEKFVKFDCTHLQGVPTQYELLLKHPGSEQFDLSGLRLIQIGGASSAESLAQRLLERAPSAKFVSAYGITEAAGVNTYTDLDDPLADVMTTVGHAAPDNEIVLRDTVDEREVPPGEVGEMWIRGDPVMRGYYDMPEATARTLVDGWLRTGDLAVADDRGYLSIVGRAVDAYKRGGMNVYPAEVEGVLTDLDEVQIAAVIGTPHPEMGEVGTAYVVPATGRHPDPQALIEHCRSQLAPYKIPARIELVDSLPMTPTGKVQKFRLRSEIAGQERS